MDESIEHSDSESGESWTLLDPTPNYGNEAPEFADNQPNVERNIEKDDDTDGISVISESETESPINSESRKCLDEILFHQPPQYASIDTSSADNDNLLEETMGDEKFLVDNTNKHKTYVHKRNKRLSAVLNIIVLGSVITAAGVAIGHMWGAKNDCTINTTPSVNKILSNLYKLQEENSYLRSKIKELSLMKNVHVHHGKSGADSGPSKCKKVFEDSLYNQNTDKPIKCVDNDDSSTIDIHLIDDEHGIEFLSDIDKLKNIYEQNKSWLGRDVSERVNPEEKVLRTHKIDVQNRKCREAQKSKGEILETINEVLNSNMLDSEGKNNKDSNTNTFHKRKISYANSLKTDLNEISKSLKPDLYIIDNNVEMKKSPKMRKTRELDAMLTYTVSEDEVIKDSRYIGHKHKSEKKKNDRQKLHKKQKRKNKYEQWEMKGGYLKDYAEYSRQKNEYVMKDLNKKFLDKDLKQILETDKNKKSNTGRDKSINPESRDDEKTEKSKKDSQTWYDKRTILRTEARKKFQHDLFGDTSPNNAGWYFRRMERREQYRTKGNNSTLKK